MCRLPIEKAEKCRILEEYSKLVAEIRDCMAVEKDMQTALNRAVDSCIEKGILKEFLLKNRAEVLEMLLEEFDAEKYERTIRGEGREEGEVKVNRHGTMKYRYQYTTYGIVQIAYREDLCYFALWYIIKM